LTIAAAAAPSFAGSTVLASNLALDTAQGADIASRFTNYGNAAAPFLSSVTAPYLALANGGRYAGATFLANDNLRVRLGTAMTDERLDRFHFDAGAPTGPLALTYDASQSKSLLGGISFDASSALGLDVTAIASEHSGLPLGFTREAGIASRSSTAAIGVSAHVNIGQGWVTTASFSEGMTQLDPRTNFEGSSLKEQSYSVAIAKRGVFGDDALGLAFLDGAVALQTNAAYQTNALGQRGATSVSLLSRAKIKF
jgi:hypothetical protein